MPIPEATLENWSHQGSVQQSAATYQTIKSALEDRSAPYANHSFHIFLQGSYGNNTNIRLDSDVDIVICTTEVFYYEVENLQLAERSYFDQAHPGMATYTFNDFKSEVTAWLRSVFGNAVVCGSKTIHVKGQGNRRNTDVLVAADHRHYWSYETPQNENYARGIVFWKNNLFKVVNYPKQHLENSTLKHQNTLSRFKPMVRVLKNMRNRMIQANVLKEGIAPSYYLEGLLSNAPDSCFGYTYEHTFVQAINYLINADHTQMTCSNGIHWLVRDGQEVCWSTANFRAFMTSVVSYWESYTC